MRGTTLIFLLLFCSISCQRTNSSNTKPQLEDIKANPSELTNTGSDIYPSKSGLEKIIHSQDTSKSNTCHFKVKNELELIGLLSNGKGFTTTSISNREKFKKYPGVGFYGTYDMANYTRDDSNYCENLLIGYMTAWIEGVPGNWKYSNYPKEFVSFKIMNSAIALWDNIRIGMSEIEVFDLKGYEMWNHEKAICLKDRDGIIYVLGRDNSNKIISIVLLRLEDSELSFNNLKEWLVRIK